MSRRLFLSLAAVAYVAAGLAAFAPILHVGFMGDDWMFLDVVAKAKSALVAFVPLNARFTRPLVVLVYYFNYHHFGLWPFPAHLALVLLHIFNAWLVCLFVLRLAPPPNRLAAGGAGLVFLLFAGHSEAVSWVAGMADAAIVPFIVGSLMLFDRALDAPRPAPWFLAGWLAGASGLLAKETAMVLPALALAYGIVPLHGRPWRPRLARTAMFAGGLALVCVAYWVFRTTRFGSSLGAYAGMGTSEGQRIAIARMFLLRTFVPPGRIAVTLWAHYLDLVLFAVLASAAAFVAVRDRRSGPGLAFLAMAMFLALGPAFPLSISLVSTLTERYVYLATVFSSALVAWLIVRIVRPPLLAALVIVLVAGLQWHDLARSNRSWIRGDEVFRSAVSGLIALAQTHGPLGASTIVLLNMPDTIERPYVDGAGVFSALRLMNPGIPEPEAHVRLVAMHDSPTGDEHVQVQQSGRRFTVDLGRDTLVDGWLRDTGDYTVLQREPHRFTIDLAPMPRRALVATVSSREVRLVTELDGTPFGFIDVPPGDAVCDMPTLRLAGWALDDEDGVDVVVEREDSRTPGRWAALGAAEWRTGTRPDVTALFAGYPSAARAEWGYALPCAAVRSGPLRIRVVARDRGGQRIELGTRTVRPK